MVRPFHCLAGSATESRPLRPLARSHFIWRAYVAAALACLTLCGCTSVLSPVNGVPARRLPGYFFAPPKANWQPIDISRLRQDPPRQYLLGPGDILGVYIEGVLGNPDEAPPVHFPERGSDLPPAMGFPVPVREDGTVALPIALPVQVAGLTLNEAEAAVRKAFTVDRQILNPGRDRIMVTLIKEREYQIIVVRQDRDTLVGMGAGMGGGGGRGMLGSASAGGIPLTMSKSEVINLPAYKNDVLHALTRTGGLPGLDAKNEVKILRARGADHARRDAFVHEFYAQFACRPCVCPPPLPDDPSVTRIPLRLPPGVTPAFAPHEVILEEGDVLLVEARETEFFYTGGLLPGGQWPLPRDYDLDVLGAMAIAGWGVGQAQGSGGGFGGLFAPVVPPTQLFILRQTPCGDQITIAVDVQRAMNNSGERLLVQPGDTLILRYKPEEEVLNFSIAAFFTYGIQALLQGND